ITFSSSGSGTLGGMNPTDPHIFLSNAPQLTNGVISDSEGPGWALYNSDSFAGYDSTRGVIPVPIVTESTPDITKNWLLTETTQFGDGIRSYNTVTIAPTTAGRSLTTLFGTSTVNTSAILLSGPYDYSIGLSNISGPGPRYIW